MLHDLADEFRRVGFSEKHLERIQNAKSNSFLGGSFVTLRLSVIGTGYLGATHAACMAELGFEVIGVDHDQSKIARLGAGELPFHEPELPELLRKHVASGRLRFTTSIAEAAQFASVHFLAVGTPQRAEDGRADMSYIDSAFFELLENLRSDSLIVGKSTVPVGTARRLQSEAKRRAKGGWDVDVAWNPEFLREGFAVADTIHPDRLVFGTDSESAETTLRAIYQKAISADTPVIKTDFETAELVKVAANAFLATKISFINAFSEITEVAGGDIRTLADAIGLDARIGRKFLNAGVGFGGGCLPKDIRALQARTSELGLDKTMNFLAAVDDVNLRRRDKTYNLAVQNLGPATASKRVAVLGASFKPGSDDVRDSPALDVASRLHEVGYDVAVYDPIAGPNAALRFPRLEYSTSLAQAVAGASLVLVLTEWDEFKVLGPVDLNHLVAEKAILDGRNLFEAEKWELDGWDFLALGRKQSATESAWMDPVQA